MRLWLMNGCRRCEHRLSANLWRGLRLEERARVKREIAGLAGGKASVLGHKLLENSQVSKSKYENVDATIEIIYYNCNKTHSSF